MCHWLYSDVQWASVVAGESECRRQVGRGKRNIPGLLGVELTPRPQLKFREVTRPMCLRLSQVTRLPPQLPPRDGLRERCRCILGSHPWAHEGGLGWRKRVLRKGLARGPPGDPSMALTSRELVSLSPSLYAVDFLVGCVFPKQAYTISFFLFPKLFLPLLIISHSIYKSYWGG